MGLAGLRESRMDGWYFLEGPEGSGGIRQNPGFLVLESVLWSGYYGIVDRCKGQTGVCVMLARVREPESAEWYSLRYKSQSKGEAIELWQDGRGSGSRGETREKEREKKEAQGSYVCVLHKDV